MDLRTVFENEAIFKELISMELKKSYKYNSDDFINICVNLIVWSPQNKSEMVKSIIQNSYPAEWQRVEKLISLK